jgi:hypothetical protein
MEKIKELMSLRKLSVFLLVMPYLTFNWAHLKQSPFFSATQLLTILICLFIIDSLTKWILIKISRKQETIISLVIILFVVVFFYGYYIANYLQKSIHDQLNILIRGRTMIEIGVAVFMLLIVTVRNKSFSYKYLNIFLVLFSVTTIITSIRSVAPIRTSAFKSNYILIPKNNGNTKPVLLIISDEYNSPDGLFNVYKDSNVYQFSKQLANNGWIVKNSFYTYETSTIHSVSSLFNFNLSTSLNYNQQEIVDIGASKLIHASIADSFKRKGVSVVNFGIFDIGESSALSGGLYMYPKTFFEDLMTYTAYYTIRNNTNNFNKNGLRGGFYPMELQNKFIFNKMTDSLNKIKNPRTFIYTHLYMPHSPLKFNPEFPLRTVFNLNNYTAYWNFTNTKLTGLLTALIKENKYKIILTGDHGYRGDKRVNPNNTFTAFYGFEQIAIESVKTVQDLGSLIIGSY